MSGGGNSDILGIATDWGKKDVGDLFNPDPKNFLIDRPLEILMGKGKKADDVKGVFSGPPKVDGAASGLSQTAQYERNIQGGASAGAIDSQTSQELMNELATGESTLASGGNHQTYEERAARGVGIQSRLDEIAAGKDTTVNDRLRLQNSLLSLRDRPGRQGLLTGG